MQTKVQNLTRAGASWIDNELGVVTKTFLFDRFLRSCWRWLRRGRGRGLTLNVMRVPGQEALETVLDVRRRGESVIFAGINHKLGGDAAEALQRLVELFGIDDGNIPVDFAAHD